MEERIVKAETKDLCEILRVYETARKFMKETGNASQWGDGYPKKDLLESDIENGRLFVFKTGEEIHAVFAFALGDDPTYRVITDGQWLSSDPYGTIHRVASDGVLHGVLSKAVAFCKEKTKHLRIDTHEDNKIMQRQIEKNGFQRCGIIFEPDLSPRIAYEMI